MNPLSRFTKGSVFFLIAVIILTGTIFISRIANADAFSKEEALHALNGLWLVKDVKALDWNGFWYDTQRQMYWPFLHSWFSALFFLVFGASYVSARVLSLAFFIATLFLMYRVCRRLEEKEGRRIGVLAVLMALASPIMIRFASENTLEGLGALIFLASFYLYIICEERKIAFYYAVMAVVVGLSIYTNYLYAYFIIPAFIVVALGKLGPILADVWRLSRKGEKAAFPFIWWAYRNLVFITVLFLVAASWFLTSSFSRKLLLFTDAVFKYGGRAAPPVDFWANLIFYPKAIIRGYTFSPWLGTLVFVSLCLPFIALREKHHQIGKLYAFVWTVLILATFTVPVKLPQFIYVIAPFLFIIFSVTVFFILERFPRHSLLVLLVILVPTGFYLPNLVKAYFPPRPREDMVQVLNYFHKSVLPRYPVASAINLSRLNSEVISFHFWDWSAPVITDASLGEEEMFDNANYFFAAELAPGSPYRDAFMNDDPYGWNTFLQEKLKAGEVREYSMRRFETIGLTARIFEKTIR